jgi:hypothetical protein
MPGHINKKQLFGVAFVFFPSVKLCVLYGKAFDSIFFHHRDTENTEFHRELH